MFVDFNKTFNDESENKSQLDVPAEFIKYMNRTVPEGVKYDLDKNGNCVIIEDNNEFTIGGFHFQLDEEDSKILGKNYTLQDVKNYSYNYQKPILLRLKKEGIILLNGQEFSTEKLSYNPLNPIKYISESLYMMPPKFSTSSKVKIGCEKYEKELIVHRVPHKSVSVLALESEKNQSLYIKILSDSKKENVTFTLSIKLENARTVREIVESISIYNSFYEGTGKLFGKEIKTNFRNGTENKYDEKSAIFWEKLLKIENLLDVQFIVPDQNIDLNTFYLVEQLYQNLVNRIPTKNTSSIDSIDGEWEIEPLRDLINKPIYFEFETTNTIELFGVKLKLPAIIGVFNAVIKEIKNKGTGQEIVLADEDANKKRYSSIQLLKNEEEMKKIREERDNNKRLDLFKKAKFPREYIE